MDVRRLPPLTALKAFEAAARLQSVTRAAEELFVTQAAVSRQIKALERELGMALFHRLHRKIEPTAAGSELARCVTESFDLIADCVRSIKEPGTTLLRISVEPALAARWLVPRLGRFRGECPDVDIVLESTDNIVTLGTEADLALRWSMNQAEWRSATAEKLCDVMAFPVMSPCLMSAGPSIDQPEDILTYPMLFDEDRGFWLRWFAEAGLNDIRLPRGPVFNDLALALDAAVRGEGIALGEPALITDDLAAGRLVAPFSTSVAFGAYWLVAPKGGAIPPAADRFASWARSEMSETLRSKALPRAPESRKG